LGSLISRAVIQLSLEHLWLPLTRSSFLTDHHETIWSDRIRAWWSPWVSLALGASRLTFPRTIWFEWSQSVQSPIGLQ
jgi:hypothetical protein